MTRSRVWQIAAIIALAAAVHGQTRRGTVSGTILDASGAVIAGARVVLTGTETGVQRSTLSNEAGIYRTLGDAYWEFKGSLGCQTAAGTRDVQLGKSTLTLRTLDLDGQNDTDWRSDRIRQKPSP